jgi:hypothetical protein
VLRATYLYEHESPDMPRFVFVTCPACYGWQLEVPTDDTLAVAEAILAEHLATCPDVAPVTSAEAIGAPPWWETVEPGDPVEVHPVTINGVSGFVLWPGVPVVPVVQFCGCGHSRPGHVDLDGACTACGCDRFTPRG